MAAKSTRSSSQKSSSFLFPEDIENLSALLEEPASIPQNTGAKPKKKSSKKALPPAEDPSASVENQIRLDLAMQLKIAEMQLQLAQLNVSPKKLQSALAPNASSSPSWPPEFGAISSLDQLRSRKKAGASLPNNFLFSAKGTVDYDKLELAEFVCGCLEFYKEQPEASKGPLLKHLQLLIERAITYSWVSVRNFHLSINTGVEQGRLLWSRSERSEWAQTFFTHQDLRSNNFSPSRSGSIPAHNKAKDLLCKEWNYSGKCSCSISDASYKAVHRCRVCDSPDHAMLTCAKRKYPIPSSQSSSASSSTSTGYDQNS